MSGFITPSTPNIADYTTFLQNIGMNTTVLPANSPWIGYAFDQAVTLTNSYGQFGSAACYGGVSAPNISYTLAVYNCGAHIQIKITPDQTGQTFFTGLRSPPPNGYGLVQFVPGVVDTAGDQGTDAGLVVADFFKNITLMDLNFLLTPYGREYLAYAQQYGGIFELS